MAAARKHAHLTEEELSEFREIFNLVDLDKGGTISKEELRQLMTTLGLKPSQVRARAHPSARLRVRNTEAGPSPGPICGIFLASPASFEKEETKRWGVARSMTACAAAFAGGAQRDGRRDRRRRQRRD